MVWFLYLWSDQYGKFLPRNKCLSRENILRNAEIQSVLVEFGGVLLSQLAYLPALDWIKVTYDEITEAITQKCAALEIFPICPYGYFLRRKDRCEIWALRNATVNYFIAVTGFGADLWSFLEEELELWSMRIVFLDSKCLKSSCSQKFYNWNCWVETVIILILHFGGMIHILAKLPHVRGCFRNQAVSILLPECMTCRYV